MSMRKHLIGAVVIAMFGLATVAQASLLYTNAGPILAEDTGAGSNLSGMTESRSSTASDTLYFKYIVDPTSDRDTENYFAAFQFYEGGSERLGVGNGWTQWAYSAFNTVGGDVDLNSSSPEPFVTYQDVRNTDTTTIVFKVKFNSGADDNVTVYLNPNLAQTEGAQAASLTTTFNANVTFDGIHLREGDDGDLGASGWTFSDIRIATSGTDEGFFAVPEPSSLTLVGLALAGLCRGIRRRQN